MKNDVYWVALQQALGEGNSRAIDVLRCFDSIIDFMNADEKTIREKKMFTPAEIGRLKKIDIGGARKIVENCNKKGYYILTPDDEQFPECLLRIKNPPVALYVKGELPNMDDEVGVCMIGTRECTKNGRIVASVLGYRLAQAGAVIISGGALGIDTACSRGAVAVNQKSVIVLGCGLDYPYLLANRDIRDEVAKNGAVITEYAPMTPPSKYTFPARNRIMSALSKAVVLIEAPEKSGALITVNHALEQGKDIYVVPGDITNKYYAGNNKLLREGANAIYTPRDVLSEYLQSYPHRLNLREASVPLNEDRLFVNMYHKNVNKQNKIENNSGKKYVRTEADSVQKQSVKQAAESESDYGKNDFSLPPLSFEADETVCKIYNCFTNKPTTVDILIEKSGLSVSDVLYAATELEMNGAIECLPGGSYRVCGR